MSRVEQADVLPAGLLHHPTEVIGADGRHKQVYVVVYQHLGV